MPRDEEIYDVDETEVFGSGPYPTGLERIQKIIQDYLDIHELSQRELSTRISTNTSLVKDILKAKVRFPRRKTLAGLAHAMQISIDDFYGDSHNPLPDFTSRTSEQHDFRVVQNKNKNADDPFGACIENVVSIQRLVPSRFGDRFVLEKRGESQLKLSSAYIEFELNADPENLGLLVSRKDYPEVDVRRGDHVLVNLGETVGHVCIVSGKGATEIREPREDDEILGHVSGVIRLM